MDVLSVLIKTAGGLVLLLVGGALFLWIGIKINNFQEKVEKRFPIVGKIGTIISVVVFVVCILIFSFLVGNDLIGR